jgi:hypothetical protein
MDLGAVLAIIVPAAVTPTIVALYARSQHGAQRKQAERDELLRTVDEATDALTTALDRVPSLIRDWSSGELPEDDARAQIVPILDRLGLMANRLVIRLGDDSALFVAYQRAALAVSTYYWVMSASDSAEISPNDSHVLALNLAQEPSIFYEAARAVVGHGLKVPSAASNPALATSPEVVPSLADSRGC